MWYAPYLKTHDFSYSYFFNELKNKEKDNLTSSFFSMKCVDKTGRNVLKKLWCFYLTCCFLIDPADNPLNSLHPNFKFHFGGTRDSDGIAIIFCQLLYICQKGNPHFRLMTNFQKWCRWWWWEYSWGDLLRFTCVQFFRRTVHVSRRQNEEDEHLV